MIAHTLARSRFTSQALWLLIGRVSAAVVSAVWFVIAARSMALGEFGSFALLLSLGLMMSILTDLGLTGLLSDAVSQDPAIARPGTRTVVCKRVPLALGAACLIALSYVAVGGAGSLAVPALFSVSVLATSAYSTITASFRALGHAGYEGANEAASRVFVLGAGALALLGGADLLGVVGVYALADCLSLIVLALLFRRVAPPAGGPAPELTLRRSRSLAAAGIVGTLYFRIDIWLLALLRGGRVVGRYSAAYRCFDALLLPALAVTSLAIPYTAGTTGEALRRRLQRLAAFSVAITTPFALGAFVSAHWLVTVLFGSRYGPSGSALKILAVGAVVTAATSVLLPPLALRSQRVALALAACLALNVGANLAVIPRYGAIGAAVVTVACEVLLGVFLVVQVRALTQPARLVVSRGSSPTYAPGGP